MKRLSAFASGIWDEIEEWLCIAWEEMEAAPISLGSFRNICLSLLPLPRLVPALSSWSQTEMLSASRRCAKALLRFRDDWLVFIMKRLLTADAGHGKVSAALWLQLCDVQSVTVWNEQDVSVGSYSALRLRQIFFQAVMLAGLHAK